MTDLVQAVRARLADGRAISDEDVVGLCKRIAELEAALDFYACVDHYQTHNAVAPNVVQHDRGAKARTIFKGE